MTFFNDKKVSAHCVVQILALALMLHVWVKVFMDVCVKYTSVL